MHEKRSLIEKVIRFLYVVLITLKRDIRGILLFLTIKYEILKIRFLNLSVHKYFAKYLKKHPNKLAFVCDESSWTFKDVEEFSNKIANYFHSQGFKAGDEVSLFMPSKPEQVLIWFGLTKIGIIPALINDNLRLHSLVHCISCLHSKAIIFDAEYEKAISDVYPLLEKKKHYSYYSFGSLNNNEMNAVNLKEKMEDHNGDATDVKHKINYNDTLFYVYTSGTTGFPKAVISKHYRMCMSLSLHKPLNLNENDIIYNPFPLYHNLGNFLGVGSALIRGRTVVLRKKFSASAFWDDCIKYKCTVAPYIGEAAAYLLKQPPKLTDKLHNVEKMYGLGMRSTIWSTFSERFGVKQIVELFGSSEGNTNLVNIDNKEGACGFIPVWVPMFVRRLLFPISFVKIDTTTSEIIRDSNGFCVTCDFGDTGMIVAKIDNNDPLKSFDGYLNKAETEKKIIRNVFRNGDSYFLSGDVLHMDEFGYIYFKDRVGDTFRWKGENVSTNEVEGLISKILNVTECVVYGVQIPNAVGKAGMVAIATSDSIDFKSLHKSMCEILPKYAIPIFIRIMKQVELTSTFKFSKVTLKNEAYDVSLVNDPIYVFDPKSQIYVKLNFELYEDILNGQITF